MNWTDKNGHKIEVGDYVSIGNIIHLIEIVKIGNKNRCVFIPKNTDVNLLIEYHFLTYKNAKKIGITKLTTHT